MCTFQRCQTYEKNNHLTMRDLPKQRKIYSEMSLQKGLENATCLEVLLANIASGDTGTYIPYEVRVLVLHQYA